jgi:hypothetical protein
VKQEGNPDGFVDNDHVQDKVAMDNDGNFLPEIDLQVFSLQIVMRILPWFVTNDMMLTMTMSLLPKMCQTLLPFCHSTMKGYLKARAGVLTIMYT